MLLALRNLRGLSQEGSGEAERNFPGGYICGNQGLIKGEMRQKSRCLQFYKI